MLPNADEDLKILCRWVYHGPWYITRTYPFFLHKASNKEFYDYKNPYTDKNSTLIKIRHSMSMGAFYTGMYYTHHTIPPKLFF